MTRRDSGGDVWIVTADMFFGFLSLILLLFLIRTAPDPDAARLWEPSVAVESLKEQILASGSANTFSVDSGFSRVHIIYAEKVLFAKCEWNLSDAGLALLTKHFTIVQRYADEITRIQIEGHADNRSPKNCRTLESVGLRRDNWVLSSLRALEVRQALESALKPDAAQQTEAAVALISKLEAVGRGEMHPLDVQNPSSERNRRIEISIYVRERSPTTPQQPAS